MRRVVITGMEAITPLGLNFEETWRAYLEGRSGIDRVTLFDASHFPTQFAGEVKIKDPVKRLGARKP